MLNLDPNTRGTQNSVNNDRHLKMDISREVLLRGQHFIQLALSVYGASVSFVAITRLQKYEETSKKLAEWSKEAAHQLHKTRTTQTSGALAV